MAKYKQRKIFSFTQKSILDIGGRTAIPWEGNHDISWGIFLEQPALRLPEI